MVFGGQHEVLCTSVGEEVDPSFGVVGRSGEVGEEVVVEEVRAIRLEAVGIETRPIGSGMLANTGRVPPEPFGIGFVGSGIAPGRD